MNKRRQQRNHLQQETFKTVGGRQKYSACTKTKISTEVFASSRNRYRHNGRLTYGYSF